tara:strand:+ start:3626 stop:4129 length:504 start_codon:yes stop_codon:yes gene_type:complete
MRRTKKLTFLYALQVLLITSLGLVLPVRAGLFSPLLWIARPQVERKLNEKCLEITAGKDDDLRERMRPTCRAFAKPIAKCLVEQSEASGRTFGFVIELVRGNFGDDSELVAKRCTAILIGAPRTSFDKVPLGEILDNLKGQINSNGSQDYEGSESSDMPKDNQEDSK